MPELTITTAGPSPAAARTVPGSPPPPPGQPSTPLRSGTDGARTLAVQQALHDQHYDPGEINGTFGLETTQAIWAFQALHGLAADGVVDSSLETAILARTPQPMLRPQLGPTHTEVDLARQVLLVFRDGQPVLVTHVSSGSNEHYCADTPNGRACGDAVTPVGVFRYTRRIQGVREADLGKLFNPVYFKDGYAVHGSPSVPDRPASHGCVRIPMRISDYYQSLVGDGETIEVFR